MEFLFRTSKAVRPFLVIYSFVAILGATVSNDLLWNIADTFNGLMGIRILSRCYCFRHSGEADKKVFLRKTGVKSSKNMKK